MARLLQLSAKSFSDFLGFLNQVLQPQQPVGPPPQRTQRSTQAPKSREIIKIPKSTRTSSTSKFPQASRHSMFFAGLQSPQHRQMLPPSNAHHNHIPFDRSELQTLGVTPPTNQFYLSHKIFIAVAVHAPRVRLLGLVVPHVGEHMHLRKKLPQLLP